MKPPATFKVGAGSDPAPTLLLKEFKIGNKMVGEGHPTLVIAELSANHLQNFQRAKELVEIACKIGVDVVKIQTYTPDTMTLNSDKEFFQVKVNEAWKGQTLHGLYQKAYTPWEWHKDLEKTAQEYGTPLIGTPYDLTSVDFLESQGCPCYKVASFEVTDIQFLRRVAQTKKPVIISRGMSSFQELSRALTVLREGGSEEIAVLHCVSAYPTDPKDLNLLTLPEIKKRFEVIVGLSDHTISTAPAVASVVLGAKIIERHLILKRSDGGPDAAFSLEPQEMEKMIKEIREVEKALGKPSLEPLESEKENIQFRRSLWAIKNIKQGQVLTKENIASFRPEGGLKPEFLPKVLGKKAKKDIDFATPVTWDLVEG